MLSDQIKEHARQMLALLSDESRWTQGSAARDSRGNLCLVNDPSAVQWCAVGAMWRTSPPGVDSHTATYGALVGAVGKVFPAWVGERGDISLSRFNDSHRYHEVIMVVRHVAEHG